MRNKSFFFTILLSCFVVVSQRVLAVTYYVSPSGDDSNPGTSTQSAWRTIDKVNTMDLNPGDSVLFEAGHDYPGNLLLTAEDTGTPTRPVVIGSYGSGRARIKAGNGSGVTVQNAGGVEVKDLVVMGDDHKTNIGSGIKIINELPNNQKLEYIRVHNVEASGFGRRNDEPLPPLGFEPLDGCGIFMGGCASDKSKSGYRDVRITNCVTYQNEYFGILTTGYWQDDPDTYANSNVYVGYCKMYDNPGDPNYFVNHSGSGILMEDVDGGLIEFCEAHNNGYACPATRGGPVGIWAAVANNVVIQHCESHSNRTGGRYDGGGFDFDGGTTNSTLQYNYSHDNDGAGFLICSYKNAPHTFNNNIVRYNISVNDSRKEIHGAINLVTGSPIEDPIRKTQIYGNTIYSSISSAISFQARKGIYNTKVFNNLFVTANNQRLVDVEGSPDKSMAVFAGNAYWAVSGKYDIAGYKSLEAWRAATGQEMLNGKPVGMVFDPKVIDLGKNPTIGDPIKLHTLTAYRLQKNSPLIDTGLDVRSLFGIDPGNRDFFGNSVPQGNGYDIGAFETASETAAVSAVVAIHMAAFAGDLSKVQSLIEAGVSPDARDKSGSTPLHWAALSDHMDVCKLLITKGADINAKNVLGRTPLLHLLSKSRHPDQEAVRFFTNKGADVSVRDEDGSSPLHIAVTKGQRDVVQLLIDGHADLNTKDNNGHTPLDIAVLLNNEAISHLLVSKDADMSLPVAVRYGLTEEIKKLIERGADVNAKDNEGQTPLDIAIELNNKDILELLVTNGAKPSSIFTAGRIGDLGKVKGFLGRGIDINAKDTRNRTALHYAAEEGHKKIVELLLAHGADVNAGEWYNRTAAELARSRGHTEIVKLLVSKGADISPLYLAIYLKDVAKARSLIESGTDVNKRSPYGTTPLHMAAGSGFKDLANLLIDKGADVNAKDNWGWTPLHSAVYGDKEIVELLIAKGANINAGDGAGRTSLWYAQDEDNTEIVELLRKHGAKE